MGAYEDYLAQAEYEDYLRQAQAEEPSVISNPKRIPETPRKEPTPYQLGPDYNQSVGQNAWKGIEDSPDAGYQLGSDVVGLTAAPQEDVSGALSRGLRAGLGSGLLGNVPSNIYDAFTKSPERGLRTVGGMAAGTAGAEALGAAGAAGGTLIWPGVGTVAGGLAGGALGFGGGLLGFDMTTDALTGSTDGIKQSLLDWYNGKGKSIDQYQKDLAYNSSQAIPFGMAHSAVTRGVPATYRKITEPFSTDRAQARVYNDLNAAEPGFADKVDPAYEAAKQAGNSLVEGYSLPELLNSDPLKRMFRSAASDGLNAQNAYGNFERARADTNLKYLNNIPGPDAAPLADAINLADTSVRADRAASQAAADAAIKERTSQTTSDITSKQAATDAQIAMSQKEIADRLDAAAAAREAAQGQVQESLLSFPEEIDPTVGGALVRQTIKEAKSSDLANVSRQIKSAGNGLVPPMAAKEVIATDAPNYFRDMGSAPNEALSSVIADLSREGESSLLLDAKGKPSVSEIPYTIQNIQDLLSRLGKVKGDRASVAVATKLADALKIDLLMAVDSGTITKGDYGRLMEGRAARLEVGKTFENSQVPAKAILKVQPGNAEPVIPNEGVLDLYIPLDTNMRAKVTIQNYKKIVGSSDAALDPLYRRAVDSFRRFAVREGGLVDAKAASKWISDRSIFLNEVPALKNLLTDTQARQQFLGSKIAEEVQAKVAAKQAEIETRKLKATSDKEVAQIAKDGEAEIAAIQKQNARTQKEIDESAAQYLLGDRDLHKVIPAILRAPDSLKQIRDTAHFLKARDPRAATGLFRGIVDYLINEYSPSVRAAQEKLKSGTQLPGDVTAGHLANQIDNIGPILQELKNAGAATESQIQNLMFLEDSLRSQYSIGKAKALSGKAGSNTASDLTVIGEMGRMAGEGYLRGTISQLPGGKFIVAVLEPLLRKMPAEKYKAAMLEANFNPRVARDFRNKATAKNVQRTAMEVFKDELSSAGLGLERLPVANADAKRNLTINKAHEATAKAVFPNVDDIRNPKAPGKLEKTSFNLDKLNPFTASTAEASDNLTIDDINRANADMTRGRGLSAETRARISVESNGNPDAISPKGAQGLSQLMPATGRWIGQQLNEPYQPLTKNMTAEQRQASIEQNIRFGDWYFRKLEEDFKDKTLARAAYNAGPARIRAAMKAAGTRDVNTILRSLPKGVQKETLPYVDKIAQRYGRG
ncbi:MAG: transglycosylase SLT domain-containing protein [Alphaproteobacteria bacterium]|nr:transglycosylase SLT domain-containing protein [Alphaproteobacteria bacterium]